jgi:hypothetical protein
MEPLLALIRHVRRTYRPQVPEGDTLLDPYLPATTTQLRSAALRTKLTHGVARNFPSCGEFSRGVRKS